MNERRDGELRFRLGLWGAEALAALLSAARFSNSEAELWTCLGTLLLVSLPVVLPRLLGFRLSRGFFVCCMLYALGPMLGKAYKLYYLTPWWDKLLHTCGGVIFAAVGTGAAMGLGGRRRLSIVFGLCFSVAVAGLWELAEYGIDSLFATDMQADTVVTAIRSHDLGSAAGALGTVTDIREVTVNGVDLRLGGYLDIGLIDTMQDMLVETVGAAAFALYAWLNRRCQPLTREERE